MEELSAHPLVPPWQVKVVPSAQECDSFPPKRPGLFDEAPQKSGELSMQLRVPPAQVKEEPSEQVCVSGAPSPTRPRCIFNSFCKNRNTIRALKEAVRETVKT